MRYIITGKVLPERADVHFEKVEWNVEGDGTVVAVCDASQITIILDLLSVEDVMTAHNMAEHFSMIVVGALGYSLGSGYSVELIHVIDELNTSFVVGVRPTAPDGTSLGFQPYGTIFNNAFQLATSNIFFRLALRDYLRAINDPSDCPTYCYRAVEAIMSSFAFEHESKKGWSLMHSSLGTDEESIKMVIKDYADPIRHGNWITAKETNYEIRWNMLMMTRNILERFMSYKLKDLTCD